jgi:protein FAM50
MMIISDSLEQEFRERTIGLVTAEEFRKAREVVDKAQSESLQSEEEAKVLKNEIKLKKKAEKRKRMMSALSFDAEPEEEGAEEEVMVVPKRVMKNPEVDTSHLPDRARDEQLEKEKEKLRSEWRAKQEITKQEVRNTQLADILPVV